MYTLKKASLTILKKENRILLLRRYNTKFGSGFYTFPSGKVELDESFVEASKREAKEEVNANIKIKDLKSVHIMFDKLKLVNDEWIHHFFLAENWSGEINNNEEDKCDDVQWFSLDKLPENILPFVKEAINNIFEKKSSYSDGSFSND